MNAVVTEEAMVEIEAATVVAVVEDTVEAAVAMTVAAIKEAASSKAYAHIHTNRPLLYYPEVCMCFYMVKGL